MSARKVPSRWQLQREELDKLAAKHRGKLTPNRVVEFAKNSHTALHARFTWDDTEAAKKYRVVEAQQLLHAYVRVLDSGKSRVPFRAFVNLKSERGKGMGNGVYRPIEDVISSPTMVAELEAEYVDVLKRAQRDYKALQKVSTVYQKVEALVE